MIYGSVCSGIEAASSAWHPLGWRAAFLSKIEPFPRAVLADRWPGVPLQLWAEAVAMESDAVLWLDTDDLRTTAEAQQETRQVEDAWFDPIQAYLGGRNDSYGELSRVRISDLLAHAVNMPVHMHARAAEMRVGKIMRTLGWKKAMVRVGAKVGRWWVREA